jgi:hypothetical protein
MGRRLTGREGGVELLKEIAPRRRAGCLEPSFPKATEGSVDQRGGVDMGIATYSASGATEIAAAAHRRAAALTGLSP